MPYQYKREPLSDDEVNRLTKSYGRSAGWLFIGREALTAKRPSAGSYL
jgi:hypothetical protein